MALHGKNWAENSSYPCNFANVPEPPIVCTISELWRMSYGGGGISRVYKTTLVKSLPVCLGEVELTFQGYLHVTLASTMW